MKWRLKAFAQHYNSIYNFSILMQEVPVYFMIPYVYDLILGPFLLVADQMRMLIFGLYNQGTIMGAITIISIK